MTPRNGSTSKAAKTSTAKAAPTSAAAKKAAPAPRPVAAKSVAPAKAPAKTPAKTLAKAGPAKPAAAKPVAVKAGAKPAAAKPVARPAPAPVARPVPKPVPKPAPTPAPVGTKVMKKDLKFLEDRLLEERGRLLKELGYLEANVLKQNQRDSSGDLSGYSFHMADLGTDAMEREKAFLFASAEGRALYDVDEALRRIYSGNYGQCENCQQPIAKERLEVVPHARLCIRCKELEEKAGRR
jgi:DnaK suppressor protein